MYSRHFVSKVAGFVCVILLLCAVASAQVVVYCNPGGSPTTEDGTSWANAWTTLDAACDDAQGQWVSGAAAEVHVMGEAGGGVFDDEQYTLHFHPTTSPNPMAPLKIMGGYDGAGGRDIVNDKTVMEDASPGTLNFLIKITGKDGTPEYSDHQVTIEGFKFQNFLNASGGDSGAIIITEEYQATDIVIKDCEFYNCSAEGNGAGNTGQGGAIFMEISTGITLDNIEVHGGRSETTVAAGDGRGPGAVVYARQQVSVTIKNSHIHDNWVTNSGTGEVRGAGLGLDWAEALVQNCVIENNVIYQNGGGTPSAFTGDVAAGGAGIFAKTDWNGGPSLGGKITIEDSTIHNNRIELTKEGTIARGAGIFETDNDNILTVTDCVVSSNSLYSPGFADSTNRNFLYGGGGSFESPTQVSGSTFEGNRVTHMGGKNWNMCGGGGIYWDSGAGLAISDSKILGNIVDVEEKVAGAQDKAAGNGAGILFNRYVDGVVDGCVIAHNVIKADSNSAMAGRCRGGGVAIDDINEPSGFVGGTHADIAFTDCSFVGNKALTAGGGIVVSDEAGGCNSYFENCLFAGNVAQRSQGGAAMLFLDRAASDVYFLNCTMVDQLGPLDNSGLGTVMYVAQGTPSDPPVRLINCLIADNYSNPNTGGISAFAVDTTSRQFSFENNLFYNLADLASDPEYLGNLAILEERDGATSTFTTSTAALDTSYSNGEGDAVNSISGDPLFSDPTTTGTWDSITTSGLYTVFTDGDASFGDLSGQLIRLDVNTRVAYSPVYISTNTATSIYVLIERDELVHVDTGDVYNFEDYHIQTGSPALDVGVNAPADGAATPVTVPTQDIDGDARILDGTSAYTAVVDLGYDEFVLTSPTFTGVGVSDASPANNTDPTTRTNNADVLVEFEGVGELPVSYVLVSEDGWVTSSSLAYNPAGVTYNIADTSDGLKSLAVRLENSAGLSANIPGQTITYDGTNPEVTLFDVADGQDSPTTNTPILFALETSEAVQDFASALDWSAGTATVSNSDIVENDPTSYTVRATGVSTTGTVLPTVLAGGMYDLAGNALASDAVSSNAVTRLFPDRPQVLSLLRQLPVEQYVSDQELVFLVTFNKPVENIEANGQDDFSLLLSAGMSGTIDGAVSSDGGTNWSVTVSLGATAGTVGLQVDHDGSTPITAIDNGQTMQAAFDAGQTYIYDPDLVPTGADYWQLY